MNDFKFWQLHEQHDNDKAMNYYFEGCQCDKCDKLVDETEIRDYGKKEVCLDCAEKIGICEQCDKVTDELYDSESKRGIICSSCMYGE